MRLSARQGKKSLIEYKRWGFDNSRLRGDIFMTLNQKGSSRTDTLVKLILVFFISLLSFSVGTFVGKQFSDSQHRLAALEGEYNKGVEESRDVASIPENGDSKPQEILSHDDVAKLAEEFVQEKPEARNVANTETPQEPVPANKPSEIQDLQVKLAKTPTKVPSQAAEKIAHNQEPLAPAPTMPEVKLTKKALPTTVSADTQGKYTIQVSSHQTEKEAQARVDSLKNKGYVASYIPATIDGKTWYRVGIGTFTTIKSAKEYLEKLKEDSAFKSAIVRQIASVH